MSKNDITVLLVEDELTLAMIIKDTLEENDFTLTIAANGEEGLRMFFDIRPDVLVADVMMPRMDGYSLLQKIRTSGKPTSNIPVVLLTAFSQRELVERATEAGALAYVVKPFTPNDLIPAIDIALGRYAQIQALEDEVADMAERLETRKILDRAKGILNDTMGLTEPEAFRWIQKASMDRRLTMKEVAQTVIDQLAEKADNPDI